jgi:lysophospholipase L1-like esterase
MKLQPKSKLLFIGDSITDCGRTKNGPSEGLFDPMGRGYVTFVDSLLGAVYPELAIRCVNVGLSGNTVRDLAGRWQTDVLDLKPDWLSVMIGTNDIWRQFDVPKMTENHVLPEEYEKTYDKLLSRTRENLKGLVLMTPFVVEANPADAMRQRMLEYGAIVKNLAERYDAVFVDTQAAFDRALKHNHATSIAWDRIHVNQTGHMILAKAFLDGIGFEWRS